MHVIPFAALDLGLGKLLHRGARPQGFNEHHWAIKDGRLITAEPLSAMRFFGSSVEVF